MIFKRVLSEDSVPPKENFPSLHEKKLVFPPAMLSREELADLIDLSLELKKR